MRSVFSCQAPDVNVPETSPPDCPSIFETWAQQGMDIIVGTSFGFQWCMAELAARYNNTVWFHISGFLKPAIQ